jgi:hypothetical protein
MMLLALFSLTTNANSAVAVHPLGASPDRANLEYYGYAVAVSANSAAVGAPFSDGMAGRAYLLTRSGNSWQRQRVDDPGGKQGDNFGWSVAVSGGTAVVGASTAGRARVYSWSGGRWRHQATLSAPGTSGFGASVAISGQTIAVGECCSVDFTGAVHIYGQVGGRWKQTSVITSGAERDSFGLAISLSGNSLLVGGRQARPGGVAYVYSRTVQGWQLQATLRPPKGTHHATFGWSVGISGKNAIIGSPILRASKGAAYIFTQDRNRVWHLNTQLRPGRTVKGSGYGYGGSVAISGSRALVGADNIGKQDCGVAYEFRPKHGSWRERAQIANPDCGLNDLFGDAVALDGRTAVIGANGKNGNKGAAYVLRIP